MNSITKTGRKITSFPASENKLTPVILSANRLTETIQDRPVLVPKNLGSFENRKKTLGKQV